MFLSQASQIAVQADGGKSILSSILAVFAAVGEWIVSTFDTLVPLFYKDESGLTFIGVLAVAGLAFSIAFLLINLIKSWLRFS